MILKYLKIYANLGSGNYFHDEMVLELKRLILPKQNRSRNTFG